MGDSPQQVPTNQASPGQYSSFSGSSAPWAKLLSQFQSGLGQPQQPSQQLSQQFQSGQRAPQQSVQQFPSGLGQPQQPAQQAPSSWGQPVQQQISPQAQAFLSPPTQMQTPHLSLPVQQQAPQSQISNFFRFGSGRAV